MKKKKPKAAVYMAFPTVHELAKKADAVATELLDNQMYADLYMRNLALELRAALKKVGFQKTKEGS